LLINYPVAAFLASCGFNDTKRKVQRPLAESNEGRRKRNVFEPLGKNTFYSKALLQLERFSYFARIRAETIEDGRIPVKKGEGK
jgi:hypothetical protein